MPMAYILRHRDVERRSCHPDRQPNRGETIMATAKIKTTVTQKLSGTCPTHSRTDVVTRDVEAVIDEPVERDGTNLGLTPTETLVSALMGCTNVIFNKCARKHGVNVKAMSVDAAAEFDRRGTTLAEEIEVPFEKITLTINLTTDASDEDVEKAKSDLQKFCPIAKVIRNAGTPVEEIWNVTRG
jgi:putative redox protein